MKHPPKVLSFLLAAALIMGLGCFSSAESVTSASASTMRLMKTDGSVSLTDPSDAPLSVREGMRLYSGSTLSTATKSHALLNPYASNNFPTRILPRDVTVMQKILMVEFTLPQCVDGTRLVM